MGTCSSKQNPSEAELRVCELENYGMDQAAKIIKLYRQLDTLNSKADADTATIERLHDEIEALKALHRADIFVLRDKLDTIRDIVTESEPEVGRPESSSRQEE